MPCLLRFDRSCLIVGQHQLTDDFLPATAVFGSPYTHYDIVIFIHCLMLSIVGLLPFAGREIFFPEEFRPSHYLVW